MINDNARCLGVGTGHEWGTLSWRGATMARCLDTSQSSSLPPTPDLQTRIRTNPRVKAVMWTLGVGIVCLVIIAAVASHVL
ncbi:hypothetical protein DTW90_31875 [Neorhizobium sp. P12A]|nr:hypothetical protein DTW90_31875 [Neorhizobium sp. P12A]